MSGWRHTEKSYNLGKSVPKFPKFVHAKAVNGASPPFSGVAKGKTQQEVAELVGMSQRGVAYHDISDSETAIAYIRDQGDHHQGQGRYK